MRKPEEIKKGLECCMVEECFGERENCPYTADPALCVGVMCEDALAYIRQLEARVHRWIPVEERLPEGNDDVIVFVQDPINGHCWPQTAHHVSALGMDECVDDEWWLDGSGETVGYITHWMPLPEPPEEVRHE